MCVCVCCVCICLCVYICGMCVYVCMCACVCVGHRLSCLRGWQLLYICSAYFLCSASLLPSLVHFLQTCIANTSSPYHGELLTLWQVLCNTSKCFSTALASMCEFNLRRSLRFGGRKDPPSTAEIQSVIVSAI